MPSASVTAWSGNWRDTAWVGKCTKTRVSPTTEHAAEDPLLKEGMVICIEPMINMGTKAVVFERDGWTVRTRDRKPAAHYEFAVAVRKNGPDVLTDSVSSTGITTKTLWQTGCY